MGRSADEDALLDRVARAVVERRLAVPAVLLLESMKPLSFLGSQALHAFEPMLRLFLDSRELRAAAQLLEDRDNVEALLRRIERLEDVRLGGGEEEE